MKGAAQHDWQHINILCLFVINSESVTKYHLNNFLFHFCSPREERAKIMCDICGSLFVSPKCLRSHLRFMHYGEPQKCPFCQYTTPAKHLLMGHCARVHKCTLDVRNMFKYVIPFVGCSEKRNSWTTTGYVSFIFISQKSLN